MDFFDRRKLLLFFVVAFGFFFRLIGLNSSVWGDETASWFFVQQSSFLEMWHFASYDPTPPLYYAVLYFVLPIIGDTPFGLRFTSLVFGTLIIPVTYWNMRQVSFSVNESLQASLLVASSSMLIYYSQEARSYSMLAFFCTLSFGVLIRVFIHPTNGNIILYLCTIPIISYTHRYGYFFVIAQTVVIGLYNYWRVLSVALLSFALVMILLLLEIVNGFFSYGPSGDVINVQNLYYLFSALNVGTMSMQYIDKIPNSNDLSFFFPLVNQLVLMSGLCITLIVIVLGIYNYKNLSDLQKRFFCLLSYCIAIPVLFAILLGTPLFPYPQWLLRGLIYIWPLYLMLVVVATRNSLRMCILIVIIVLNIFSLCSYYVGYNRFEKELVFEQLNKDLSVGDLIVVDPWYMFGFVDYYINKPFLMIGYSDDYGWVNLGHFQYGYDSEKFHLSEPPKISGRIFVYYRTENLAWTESYSNNLILVYNYKDSTWQYYRNELLVE